MPNIENIINQVKRTVESDKRSEIRLNANGGNSILVVCPPELEIQYIDKLNALMPQESYKIIDINEILIAFVERHKDELPEMFDLLRGSVHQIFKSPKEETSPDLYSQILSEIENSFNNNRIPVLTNTGALYGSGIENIHLMENDSVMKSKIPLILLYPATQQDEQLLFLDFRPASKYRCMIIK